MVVYRLAMMLKLSDFCSGLPAVKKEIAGDASAVRFYDIVNSLFTKKSVPVENVSIRAVLNAVSMDSSLLPLCARLSKYVFLDNVLFLKILKGILPKRNSGFGFFKYIKREDVYDRALLILIAGHFHVNISESERISRVLEHESIAVEDVRSFFGIQKK